jgi:hypothetical protein
MRKTCAILIIFLAIPATFFAQIKEKTIRFKSVQSGAADWIRTLKSLRRAGDLYVMTYYDNYNQRLIRVNRQILTKSFESVTKAKTSVIRCSMFAAFGGSPFYGRNFDNPPCGVLVALYRPEDGYDSIGFSRLRDLGFSKGEDPTKLPINKRQSLLNAPFFTPDGMNECGLAVALAALPTVKTRVDKKKKSVFITQLVREILDHAKDIKEAVAIINTYNIYDSGIDGVSHHLLISDPENGSAIIEYANNGWQVMPGRLKWQAITNTALFQIPEVMRRGRCWRYRTLADRLTRSKGNITWQQGMDILRSVAVKGTQWSTICDLRAKQIYISTYRNYHHILKAGFE